MIKRMQTYIIFFIISYILFSSILLLSQTNLNSDTYSGTMIVDNTQPKINIVFPTNNYHSIVSKINLLGTYEELHIDSISANGTEAIINYDKNKFVVTNVLLNEGTNYLHIIGKDTAGNITDIDLQVMKIQSVVTSLITTNETTIEFNDVSIIIPAGAVDTNQTIEISINSPSGIMPDIVTVGNVYSINPVNGETLCFNGNILLKLKYDPNKLPYGFKEEELKIFVKEKWETEWKMAKVINIDKGNHILTAEIPCFSDYLVAGISAPNISRDKSSLNGGGNVGDVPSPLSGLTTIAPPQANVLGSAVVSYPIEYPSDRGNISLLFNLIYNSDHKNGVCGIGWDLSVPYIAKKWATGFAPFSLGNLITSDGEELVRVDAGSGYVLYRSRIQDGNYIEYKVYGISTSHGFIPSHIIAFDKNGVQYEYTTFETGYNEDVINVHHRFKWYLTKIIDTLGNYAEYHYFTNYSKQYLREIVYGGKKNEVLPITKINFEYESRVDDNFYNDKSGVNRQIKLRLHQIKVERNNSKLLHYDFVYSYSQLTGDSLLKSIKKYRNDDLIDTKYFDYSEDLTRNKFHENLFHFNICVDPSGNIQKTSGDFDGDGRSDILLIKNGRFHVYFPYYNFNGNDWGTAIGSLSDYKIGDFNGDGKSDLITKDNSAIKVFISTGNHFQGSIWNSTSSLKDWLVSDFNGDGKSDLFGVLEGQPMVFVPYHNHFSFGFSLNNHFHESIENFKIGDFNGDGKSDLLQIGKDRIEISISTNNNFFEFIWDITNFQSPVVQYSVDDINDDGYSDFVFVSNYNAHVFLSHGYNKYNKYYYRAINGKTRIGDLNSDGATEYIQIINNQLKLDVSKIHWFFVSYQYFYFNPQLIETKISDFNGDKRNDFMWSGEHCFGTLLSKGGASFYQNFSWKESNQSEYSVGDIDGDNIPDYVQIINSTNFEVILGKRLDKEITTNWDWDFTNSVVYKYNLGDINNDRYLDFILICSNRLYSFLSQNNSLKYLVKETYFFSGMWFDINNDGYHDSLTIVDNKLELNLSNYNFGLRYNNFYFSSELLRGRVGDFNKDGNKDFILMNSFSMEWLISSSYFYNKFKWIDSTHKKIFIDDMNYDGRLDFIQITNSLVEVFISDNNNYTEFYWYLKDINMSNYKIGDFNGDGKSELLTIINGQFRTYSFINKKFVGSNRGVSTGSMSDYIISDFNGDGKSDLFYSKSGVEKIYISKGYNFGDTGKWDGVTNSSLIGDYNGDGSYDLFNLVPQFLVFNHPSSCCCYGGSPHPGIYQYYYYRSYYSLQALPSLLIGIRDSHHLNEMQLTYVPSRVITEKPYKTAVLQSVTTEDGQGNNYQTKYEYLNGKYDKINKEFIGYEQVKTISPNGLSSVTYYSQTEYLKNKVYKSEMKDKQGKTITKTEFDYYQLDPIPTDAEKTVLLGSINSFRYMSDIYELVKYTQYSYPSAYPSIAYSNRLKQARNEHTHKRVWYNYDEYGNIIEETYYGADFVTEDEGSAPPSLYFYKKLAYEYSYNLTTGIKNALTHKSIKNSMNQTLWEEWYSYDDIEQGVGSVGLLTKVETWNNKGLNVSDESETKSIFLRGDLKFVIV